VPCAHKSIGNIRSDGKKRFDHAVLTYVLHEVPAEDRSTLLDKVAEVADSVIIGDYLVPVPEGFWSFLNNVVQRAAGRDHYRNFRSYVNRGGLARLLATMHLELVQEFKDALH
jgi:hypothetical protein